LAFQRIKTHEQEQQRQAHVVPLQHAATHGNTLQHAVILCNTLRRWALVVTLQHAATRYNMLQHAATCCNMLQRRAHAVTLQHAATRCNATHCNTWQLLAHVCHHSELAGHIATRRNMLQHAVKYCNALPDICDTLQHAATHQNTM